MSAAAQRVLVYVCLCVPNVPSDIKHHHNNNQIININIIDINVIWHVCNRPSFDLIIHLYTN